MNAIVKGGASRDQIIELENEMKKMPQMDFELKHTFAPGVYVREIFIPAGSMIVGKIHRHAHANIIVKGLVEVVTEFDTETYQAPCTFVSKVGTKRALVALEDTIWITIHPTDLTDIDEIEAEIIAPDYEQLLNKKTIEIEVMP